MNAENIKFIKLAGEDDVAAIQRMLDKGGYVYIPDGKYNITRPLIIHSNTHLCLSQQAVFRLADGANCSILDNEGLYSDQTTKNVIIEGGIWDGNNDAQQRQPIPNEGAPGDSNEDKPCDKQVYISNIYTVFMVRLVHIENLTVRNLTYKNPTSYAIQIADCKYFKVEDITFDYNLSKKNMDGIHIQGPARFGYIHNIFGNANDDHVALCANGTIRSEITKGTIEDITIDGIYCDNGYTGVRLLSRGNFVRNIKISNIHGAFRYYAVSFTHHYPLREDKPILIENVHVSNLYISRPEKSSPDILYIANKNDPLVWVESGVNCKNITLEKIYKNGGVTTSPMISVSQGASVENFVTRDIFE